MKRYLFIVLISSLLFSCGGNNIVEEENVETPDDQNVNDVDRVNKTKQVFYTFPSPLETVSIFEEAGVLYNSNLLNSTDNLSSYSTNAQRALNFGVYGADLSYTNIFDQINRSMAYMNCVQKLASALGLISVFESETMDRLEENIENRDSLTSIINEAYWEADAYLKENEQSNLSVLVVSGGWIETLFLGSKAIDIENPHQEIEKRIAEQKYSLNNLIELLQTYNDAEVLTVLTMLEDLQISFNKIKEDEEKTSSVITESGVTTVGGGTTLVYDSDIIIEIAKKAEKIRNEIIQ